MVLSAPAQRAGDRADDVSIALDATSPLGTRHAPGSQEGQLLDNWLAIQGINLTQATPAPRVSARQRPSTTWRC